ncbi:hypothetical protein STRUR_1029 [Streptococcus urinalis 2285-97]|uniref:Uncharacterized protein n=1 Tax=Streptococcus urinalis 2285-97 TaxID=764291 RepID=G5KFM2_9STRE|nr:hypothetical protein STRUR_1029 [Streptococcus urinalis 2285-97]
MSFISTKTIIAIEDCEVAMTNLNLLFSIDDSYVDQHLLKIIKHTYF